MREHRLHRNRSAGPLWPKAAEGFRLRARRRLERFAVGGRAYWTRVVAEFERSGEQQADFCAQRGLGLSSLQHWLYRLKR